MTCIFSNTSQQSTERICASVLKWARRVEPNVRIHKDAGALFDAFYTHFAKLLQADMEEKILLGQWTTADKSHAPYMMVPNMTLHGQLAAWTQRAKKRLYKAVWGNDAEIISLPTEDDSATLSELFEALAAEGPLPADLHFHWLCCSNVELRKAGGAHIGFNASDFVHNPQYQGLSGRYRNQNKKGLYKAILGELKRRM